MSEKNPFNVDENELRCDTHYSETNMKSIENKRIKLCDLKHDSYHKYDISQVKVEDNFLKIFLRPIWASEWWGNSDMIQIPLD